MKYVIATIWMLAAPALAQDIDYDPAVLAMCLENAETLQDRTYCIGQGAQACTRTDAGQSTPGLSYCYGAEWGDWDGRLNAVYGTLLEQQPELAEDNAAFNSQIPDARTVCEQRSGLGLLCGMRIVHWNMQCGAAVRCARSRGLDAACDARLNARFI
jgi:hypothetical protein